MTYYVDNCCGCVALGFPCIGESCPNRKVPHHQCDECDATDEDTKVYKYDGRELCIKCIENELDEA